MIDFAAVLLDPIYATLGVPATLTLTDSREFDLTVIDKTSGVKVGENTEVATILPVAAIRYAELTGLGLNKDDAIDGTLTFNGFTWVIQAMRPDPNPSGERSGELWACLRSQTPELASSES